MIRAALLLALLAVPAAAQERRETRVDIARVSAGQTVERVLDCGRGRTAISGGWRFYSLPDDEVVWFVHASHPTDEGSWRFLIQNLSGRSRPLLLRLYVICL